VAGIDPSIALSFRPPQVQDPLDKLAQLAQLRNAQQQQAMGMLQLKQQAQAMQDDQAMRQVFAEHGGDMDKALPALAGKVSAQTWMGLQNKWQENLKTRLANAKTQGEIASQIHESMGKLALGVKAAGNTLPAFMGAVDTFSKLNPAIGQHLTTYVQQAQQNPASIPAMIDQLIGGTETGQKERTTVAAETNAAANKDRAGAMAGKEGREAGQQEFANAVSALGANPPKTAADYQKALDGLPHGTVRRILQAVPVEQFNPQTFQQQIRQTGMSPVQQAQAVQSAANAAETARHNKVEEGQGATRINLQRTAQSDLHLTPEGLDAAAHQFAMTGQLPALGMGAGGTKTAIINRAAALYPGVDLASNRAAYDANKSSLAQLQRSRDAVVAFEGTAMKNLDLFLTQAKGIMDSGSPIINKPLRSVGREVIGSTNIAAFEAARRVAINEIAKVTSNPNLTGQLSDAARKEVEEFVPQNATFAQCYSVAQVLKQDMGNRHGELDKQIDAIKQRIGGARRGSGGTSNQNAGQQHTQAGNEKEDLSRVSTDELLRRLTSGGN